ncbi:MAG TPA: diguanylate cyclase [Burkholderiales bacterium]|nr:diguanylate cyclase [Burkholderiales bacterium]
MTGTYDWRLVVLSWIVAAIASYTALDLAGRVGAKQGWVSRLWLLGGAFAMGTGIWAMHFIGMLAFSLPIPLAYDIGLNALSWAIAMAASGVALYVAGRPAMTARNLALGAAFMGAGISSMHYTGMAALRMSPPIEYDPRLFAASVAIAIAASLAALWIAFQLRGRRAGAAILAKLGSALVMGFAVVGMHYTGMAAASFAPGSVSLAADSTGGMGAGTLAFVVGLATISILAIALVISATDAHVAARTAQLAERLRQANEDLRNIALYDRLTGLPNRFLLEDRIDQARRRADRSGRPFAVMFVDLDRFKPVNDNFGHAIGDELLKAVAQRLLQCVRREDTVARVGGDEFVVVLTDLARASDAAQVGAKILEELAQPFLIGGYELDISCSIGISVYPEDGSDLETLMANADIAMYQAKKSGRNACLNYNAAMRAAAPG